MKNILVRFLLVVFCFWFSNAKAQVNHIDTVNCNLSSYITQVYGNDAMRLALREIYAGNTNFTDSIIIPQTLYVPILKDLSAIYNTFSPPADSVFNIYHIVTFPVPFLDYFDLGLDTNELWVKNWLAGNILSGKDSIDALMNSYGLYYGGIAYWSLICHCPQVKILTNYPLNIRAIVTAFTKITGVKSGYEEGILGDGSDLTMNDSITFREYIFRLGGGDCPAGCAVNHYWKFHVYPGCAVQYMGSWGTPLQFATDISSLSTAATSFSLSPNPAATSVTITTGEAEMIGSNITVTDITGRKIEAVQLSTQNSTLSTASYNNGVYFITLTTPNGISATKKLVVSK